MRFHKVSFETGKQQLIYVITHYRARHFSNPAAELPGAGGGRSSPVWGWEQQNGPFGAAAAISGVMGWDVAMQQHSIQQGMVPPVVSPCAPGDPLLHGGTRADTKGRQQVLNIFKCPFYFTRCKYYALQLRSKYHITL